MRGGIVVDDLGVDPDRAQGLAQVVPELTRLLEPRRGQEPDPEARAARTARVAGLVQERVGAARVEGGPGDIRGMELPVELRDRSGGGLGVRPVGIHRELMMAAARLIMAAKL